jgi:suppressor of ftsI
MSLHSANIRKPSAVSRRTVLFGTAAVTLLATTGCIPYTRDPISTVGEIKFNNPLRIPRLADSTVDGDGVRNFDLTARAGTTEFLAGKQTPTWGFNRSYLGETLRVRQGEKVRFNVRNELDETTTVHWHGMHLPAEMDGTPHQPVSPGGQWHPHWTIHQQAATLWYHPHPHGETEDHVNNGLAGMFIIDDDESDRLGLPSEYGVDDVPVIVQDRSFDDEGEFSTSYRGINGFLGDNILVNGTYAPYLDVETELVRLRILNGSSARIYNFKFDDGRRFDLIGTDGGLLDRPRRMKNIVLSPAERAEIVVRMKPGSRTTLRSAPQDLGAGVLATGAGGNDRMEVLQLRARSALKRSGPLPGRLADVEPLRPAPSTTKREFVLDGVEINGKDMNMNRIDTVVPANNLEVWTVRNVNGQPHNFHIHDVQYQVLEVDGHEPPPELSGWKDTVFLPGKSEVRLAVPFGSYTNPHVPYMYHCHLLWHEDRGMMGQFTVVDPDQVDSAPRKLDMKETHHHA